MNQETQLWYIKVKGRVKGPYASGFISKNILLGRIHPGDMLSQDKNNWQKASSIPEVMPEVIKHRHEANYKERLNAARRWADERSEVREVDFDGNEKIYIPRKQNTRLKIKTTGYLGILGLIGVFLVLFFLLFKFTPDDPLAQVDCNARPHNGVIYDGCHLQRKNFSQQSLNDSSFKNTLLQNTRFSHAVLINAQMDYASLSHADFSHANLSGASLRAVDLRAANLSSANFTNANLSYADLTGAKSNGIVISGTILSNTIWFDGRICSKESIGRCISR